MTVLERRKIPFINRHPELADIFDAFPLTRPFAPEAHFIRVEEFQEGDAYVVRAELPGIDPDRDVDVMLDRGMLTIHAERSEEQRERQRSEFRYGAFTRSISLPEGVSEDDITASYDKGILTVKAPLGEAESIRRHIHVGGAD